MKRTTERLAARHHLRQVAVSRRADRAADRASLAVGRIWRQVLHAIKARDCGTCHVLLHGLTGLLRRVIAVELADHAHWSHRTSCANIRGEIPRETLRGLCRGQVPDGHSVRLGEEGGGVPPRERGASRDGRIHSGGRASEAKDRRSHCGRLFESFGWADLLAHLRLDSGADDGGVEPDWAELLFPAPSHERVSQVVYGSGWQDRLRAGTGLGSPDNMAARVVTGMMLGKTHQEIARDLLPEVNRVQATARRIARTESLRVAHAVQMDAHQQLGDLVVGYRVNATLDANTRPWHRERDGTVYYLDPGPGQKGMQQCPHPPDEAADPGERPAGTPSTAWNCRCFLTPVLRD